MENKFQKYYQQVWDKVRKENPTYVNEAVNQVTQEIIDLWLPELEQNFFEWLNDEPLSDIKIYDLSIKDIFDVWEQDPPSFYRNNIRLALKRMRAYINYSPDFRERKGKYVILNGHKIPGYRLCDQ